MVVMLLGIVGARLYHVFSSPAGTNLGWAYHRIPPFNDLSQYPLTE
jgi:hypothetical protein